MRCARQAATCLELEAGRPWRIGGLRGGWEGFKINEESSQVWSNPLSKPPEELKERLQEKMKNEVQNGPPNHENSSPRGCPGALWRPPGWFWGLWGPFLRFLARSGGDFWRSWSEDGPKMDARWAKLAASCGQDGPWWRQDGHLGFSLKGFWVVLGSLVVTFFAIFGKMAEV